MAEVLKLPAATSVYNEHTTETDSTRRTSLSTRRTSTQWFAKLLKFGKFTCRLSNEAVTFLWEAATTSNGLLRTKQAHIMLLQRLRQCSSTLYVTTRC
jgi:hypothetical protein